jgi:hypothetical protein
MNSQVKLLLLGALLAFGLGGVNAQCSTTVSFDVWLSANESTNQSQELSGTVTSVQFNLNFSGQGNEWPADMIVAIYAPNGNCIAGEGYNVNPPSNCYDINFPPNWSYSTNGYYTYTMYLPANYLSGDGSWYFTVQNGWTYANNTHYDLDIILNGICDQGGCTNPWACNYDPDAAYSDNTLCEYPDFGYDCDGNCVLDTDGDGICDMFEVPGCPDFAACNYNLVATDNDGSCVYALLDEDCNGNNLLPTFNNAPADIAVSCTSVPSPTTVYASISPYASEYEEIHNPEGNCYAAVWTVEVSMIEELIPGNCPGNYQLIRHYTGIDCMNRTVEHTQFVDVVDNTPPVFTSGLESQTTSCPLLTFFENAQAVDACSEPLNIVIGEQTTLDGECDGEYTLYRLVTATDACGNSSTAEQTIVVIDETPPVWTTLIAEQVISDEIETGDFGTPDAEDLCSSAVVTVTSEIGPGVCPLAIELTRTFIATDECGNESEPFVQVINETTDLFSNVVGTTDAMCSYSDEGTVTIETVGGVHPYEESWGNLDPNALPAGDYEVTVTDDNLCSTILTFTIGAPPALQLTLESSLPECTEPNSGTISAIAGEGTGELTYDWGGINPESVSAGDYEITITDENGCSLSEAVTVSSAIIPVEGEIDGDTEVMLGDSSVYEYDFTAGSTYNWTFFGADSLVVSDIFAISLLWSGEGAGSVCVQETNATGCEGDEVCIEINVSVGLDELVEQDDFISTYPNPSTGNFTCVIPDLVGTYTWKLVSITGTTVASGSITSSDNLYGFSFSELSSGSYLLMIDNRAIAVQIEK